MNETIQYYSRNPGNKGVLEDYTVSHWEDNRACGEDLKVYLKIEDNVFVKYSFDGDLSIITTACSAVFGEAII
jgi:NifU-like protein involved in Fe-S cluster formation